MNDRYLELIGTFCAYLSLFRIPFNVSPCWGEGYEVTFSWTNGKVVVHDDSPLCGRGFITCHNFPWNEGNPFSCYPEEMGEKIEEYYQSLRKEQENGKHIYKIHVGVRFTTNWEIEALTEEEALEKAELKLEEIESPKGFEFANDDYDILEVK